MVMAPIEVATVTGDHVTLPAEEIETLTSHVEGPLLRPGDEGWDAAVLIWNGMVAQTPAAVLRPTSAADVAAGVTFAADHGLLLSIKGGGHNIAGTSIAPGGLTLDMSLMGAVEVDVDRRRATVGAGCILRDVDVATQAHGLATVLGFVSETGVAGLTLGGGFGYLTRRFGWTVDCLQSVEMVTADGQVRTASRDENEDLFWAVRGGGGNFGVVTRFTFELHEVGPDVTGGLILWPGDRAEDALALYREITAAAPREFASAFTIRLAPPAPFVPPEFHGKLVAGMVVCHSGPDAAADLAPLESLGEPLVNLVARKPYAAQQSMLDATQPKGPHYYWKTEFVSELADGFLEHFYAGALNVTSPMSQSILFHLAGAVNERPADDGAVGNRDAHFVTGFAGSWLPPDPRSAEHIHWARSSWEGIRPYGTGGNYVNFQLAEDDAGRTAAAYGPNHERLRQVKSAYDPHNLFRVNRNIAPAPPT